MQMVRLFRLCALVVSTILILCRIAGAADNAADSFRMHTSEPLYVENTLLKPGTYLLKRMDSPSDKDIVLIRDERTHRQIATILAIPSYREFASMKNVVDFWETPSGTPKAIRAWFSPGRNYGQEFPFPSQLASIKKTVPYSPSLLTRPESVIPTSERLPLPVNPELKRKPVRMAEQQGSWAVITDGGGTQDARQQPPAPIHKKPGTIWDALANLPLTATIAPLIGLVGIISLALFLVSHLKRRKQLIS